MGGTTAASNDGSKDTQTFGYETEKNKQKQKKKKEARDEGFRTTGSSIYSPPTTTTNNNNNGGGGNGGNDGQGTNILITPTVAEVSQSNAANATTPVEKDPLYLRKKKTKAKGRSVTILTSSKGVTTDDNLTLGKKSLLGS